MRKATYVKFHQGLFAPGIGTIGDTLPSNSKTIKDLSMWWGSDGFYISVGKVQIVVPHGNVVSAVLAPQEEASKLANAA